MTNDAAVACHRVRSAGYAGYGVWRDGDIPIDEAQYWESADSSFYIERAYSATTVAELRDNAAKWKSLHDAMVLVHDVQERRIGRMTAQLEAAERRVAELRQALLSVEAALGPNVHLYDTTSDMARALEVATAALTKESP